MMDLLNHIFIWPNGIRQKKTTKDGDLTKKKIENYRSRCTNMDLCGDRLKPVP